MEYLKMFRNILNRVIFLIFIVLTGYTDQAFAQINSHRPIPENGQLPFSNLDNWYYRIVKESGILGGEIKFLYEIGMVDTTNVKPDCDTRDAASPWSTTNLRARMGVDIGQTCVFPEQRGNGNCARLETKIRKINILGLKLEVLVTGTLFLGDLIQPVCNVKNPIKKLNHGIPFTEKPKAIQFDFKYISGKQRVNAVYRSNPAEGSDKAELCLILQKRWEDENGNVFATRIGGARYFFEDTNNAWVNDTTLRIYYGDITGETFYVPEIMGLIPEVSELCVKNSKGKLVPLTETGWGNKADTPSHLVLYFDSSYEGIHFTGSPESVLWIDNVELLY